MTHTETFSCRTDKRSHWVDVTGRVAEIVSESGVSGGICLVSSPHTTAGVTINENADPAVGRDFFRKLDEVYPQKDGYDHLEGNSDSHIKAALVGFGAQIPVQGGGLVLGTWQGVYLCEFDGPRNRRVVVTIVGE